MIYRTALDPNVPDVPQGHWLLADDYTAEKAEKDGRLPLFESISSRNPPPVFQRIAPGQGVLTTGEVAVNQVSIVTNVVNHTVVINGSVGPMPVDTTGDGIVDSVAVDTTGDGVRDTVMKRNWWGAERSPETV